MRPKNEVIEFAKGGGMFDFRAEVILPYLTYEEAKPLLKEDASEEEFNKVKDMEYTDADVLKEMGTYMENYGWPKARNHRGLSAMRTISKMRAWVFMLGGHEALLKIIDDDSKYAQYGAPILEAICNEFGFPIPEGEALARMRQGLPCEEGCSEGCGR